MFKVITKSPKGININNVKRKKVGGGINIRILVPHLESPEKEPCGSSPDEDKEGKSSFSLPQRYERRLPRRHS